MRRIASAKMSCGTRPVFVAHRIRLSLHPTRRNTMCICQSSRWFESAARPKVISFGRNSPVICKLYSANLDSKSEVTRRRSVSSIVASFAQGRRLDGSTTPSSAKRRRDAAAASCIICR